MISLISSGSSKLLTISFCFFEGAASGRVLSFYKGITVFLSFKKGFFMYINDNPLVEHDGNFSKTTKEHVLPQS